MLRGDLVHACAIIKALRNKKTERASVGRVFGMTVRALRKRLGIGQEKLALEAGIDRGYMSALERGLHTPRLDNILRLLPLLGVSFPEFAAEYERQAHRRRQRNQPEA